MEHFTWEYGIAVSIPVVAIWRKRTGFLVLLFSFLPAGMVVVSASIRHVKIELEGLVFFLEV